MRHIPDWLACVASAAVLACGSSTPTTPGGSGGGTNPPPATAEVTVGPNGSQAFSPASVTIAAGGSVTWTWASSGHNVVGDNGTPARSGALANAGTTYTATFPTAGVYHYYCEAHGAPNGVGMSGTVTVQ